MPPSKKDEAETEIVKMLENNKKNGLSLRQIKKGVPYNEQLIKDVLEKLHSEGRTSETMEKRTGDRQMNKVFRLIA